MRGGPTGNRTRVQGFAVLCVTTPPSGLGEARFGGLGRRLSTRPFDEWRPARLALAGGRDMDRLKSSCISVIRHWQMMGIS